MDKDINAAQYQQPLDHDQYQQGTKLQGLLTEFGLMEVLQIMDKGGWTGTIHLKQATGGIGIVYIKAGKIATCSELSAGALTLADVLQQLGMADSDQIDIAFSQRFELAYGKHMGERLVEIGAITNEQLREALRIKALWTMRELALWKEGTYEFIASPNIQTILPYGEASLDLEIMRVTMEMVRYSDEWAQLFAFLPQGVRTMLQMAPAIPYAMSFDARTFEILSCVNIHHRVRRIASALRRPELEVAYDLAQLIQQKFILPILQEDMPSSSEPATLTTLDKKDHPTSEGSSSIPTDLPLNLNEREILDFLLFQVWQLGKTVLNNYRQVVISRQSTEQELKEIAYLEETLAMVDKTMLPRRSSERQELSGSFLLTDDAKPSWLTSDEIMDAGFSSLGTAGLLERISEQEEESEEVRSKLQSELYELSSSLDKLPYPQRKLAVFHYTIEFFVHWINQLKETSNLPEKREALITRSMRLAAIYDTDVKQQEGTGEKITEHQVNPLHQQERVSEELVTEKPAWLKELLSTTTPQPVETIPPSRSEPIPSFKDIPDIKKRVVHYHMEIIGATTIFYTTARLRMDKLFGVVESRRLCDKALQTIDQTFTQLLIDFEEGEVADQTIEHLIAELLEIGGKLIEGEEIEEKVLMPWGLPRLPRQKSIPPKSEQLDKPEKSFVAAHPSFIRSVFSFLVEAAKDTPDEHVLWMDRLLATDVQIFFSDEMPVSLLMNIDTLMKEIMRLCKEQTDKYKRKDLLEKLYRELDNLNKIYGILAAEDMRKLGEAIQGVQPPVIPPYMRLHLEIEKAGAYQLLDPERQRLLRTYLTTGLTFRDIQKAEGFKSHAGVNANIHKSVAMIFPHLPQEVQQEYGSPEAAVRTKSGHHTESSKRRLRQGLDKLKRPGTDKIEFSDTHKQHIAEAASQRWQRQREAQQATTTPDQPARQAE